jgi:hypothetical protein
MSRKSRFLSSILRLLAITLAVCGVVAVSDTLEVLHFTAKAQQNCNNISCWNAGDWYCIQHAPGGCGTCGLIYCQAS